MGPTDLHITTLHGSLILLGGLTTAPLFRTLLLSEHSSIIIGAFFGLNCLLMQKTTRHILITFSFHLCAKL